MDATAQLAADSRDGHLALRRVERQQLLIERLVAARRPVPMTELATELRVSARTLSRDAERLRDSGVPILVRRGRGGGLSLPIGTAVAPIQFDLSEVAALLSSLAVLGPTATSSSGSAMRKLADSLQSGRQRSEGSSRRTE